MTPIGAGRATDRHCVERGRAPRSLALVLGLVVLACGRSEAAWRGDLAHPDPFVRGLAAIGLSVESPRQAGAALGELLAAIDHVDGGLGPAAAQALARAAPYHVPALLEQLVDELISAERRRALQDALVAVGPPAAEALVTCMRGPGRHAVGALGEVLLALGEPAVPFLVTALEEEADVRLRNYAAFLLAWIGPRARAALPALRRAAASADPDLARMANEAVASLEGRAWQVPKPGAGR